MKARSTYQTYCFSCVGSNVCGLREIAPRECIGSLQIVDSVSDTVLALGPFDPERYRIQMT